MSEPILRASRNCWKIADASRVQFLIDGAAYFSALGEALAQAEESILILGWDFDSRIQLKPERDFPNLGNYLNALAELRPALNIHILVWDFAMIFALDRETMPTSAIRRTVLHSERCCARSSHFPLPSKMEFKRREFSRKFFVIFPNTLSSHIPDSNSAV